MDEWVINELIISTLFIAQQHGQILPVLRTLCTNKHMTTYPCSPVRVLLQHLVDADAKGLIIETFVDEVFIYSKLRSGDRLPLRDPR